MLMVTATMQLVRNVLDLRGAEEKGVIRIKENAIGHVFANDAVHNSLINRVVCCYSLSKPICVWLWQLGQEDSNCDTGQDLK